MSLRPSVDEFLQLACLYTHAFSPHPTHPSLHFRVQPVDERDQPVTTGYYIRSGLLGFVGTGGLVFICGTLEGLIPIGGRRHNTEDLIATVMAVEPHSFIYKGRIAVFSVTVLREERVVVVAEQKPNCTDEEAFTWMNSMVPAVESIHSVNVYGIVLVSAGRLPRGANGLVQVHEAKQHFLDGSMHPVNLLMCPYQCISSNLPLPKAHTSESLPLRPPTHLSVSLSFVCLCLCVWLLIS